jgi:hypothetical protein
LKPFLLSQRLRRYAVRANFAILVPFPGTRIYDMALNAEAGLRNRSKDWALFGKQAGFALQHRNLSKSRLERY